jgi:cobalt-zinc-cadmium resistance protein CzcA
MQLDIVIDRMAIARHGITVEDINGIVEAAVGGKAVSEFNEGDRKFSVAVRYPERYRGDVKAISNILVPSPMGHQVPLGQLAALRTVETPNQISRENGMRRVVVECNVRGRDIGSFIAEVQRRIGPVEKTLPTGYFIEYGGQFENQQRAMRTLAVVVPVVIILIFLLLYMALGSARPALLVILNLPFAWVGGVLVVVLFNITLSVSAVVGFITLFGIAVANGTVLVAFMQQLREQGLEMREVVMQACAIRLRPLLLTSLAAMLGLIPVLLAQGPGAEIQKPLAAVVLGGLFTSFFMTMIVLPVLYETLGRRDK